MSDTPAAPYQVLARKYRPETFADLIGQDAMVRTLRNAFAADRIAHAFVMTGIRGTGKTTTARIIAKGMNCIGPDGQGGPTVSPCGVCEHCLAIAQGRHVDVMEMDAASRTGVGDIREIIDAVRYRAASARYKVYIIDEVHMLSVNAFNALLKTLEEPPEHVKFIFATTEIRKVPVTVLSRCQRFDLRRIEPEEMGAHLARIAAAEGAQIADDALALIVRAAEGSVRDALSLMDQAIAHGGGETSAAQVRAMLGLADRARVLDLFEMIMRGDAAGALAEVSAQYAEGADPAAVLRDLAEVTHWISLAQVSPGVADDPTVTPDERRRGADLAGRLPMRVLSRAWQMLLKAMDEVALAPNAMMAAEMAIIRLTHVADLPAPADLVRRLQGQSAPGPGEGPRTGGGAGGGPGAAGGSEGAAVSGPGNGAGGAATMSAVPRAAGQPALSMVQSPAPAPSAAPSTDMVALAAYAQFADVLALIRERRDMGLLVDVEHHLRLVHYAPGRIEFQPTDDAPPDLSQRLGARLGEWTGARWGISLVSQGGGETLREIEARAETDLRTRAAAHPLVQAALEAFPGAEIRSVQTPDDTGTDDIVPTDPDDPGPGWDPFDPFDEEY